jgi:hypothetical protein
LARFFGAALTALIAILGSCAGYIWYVDPGNHFRMRGFEATGAAAFVRLRQGLDYGIVLKPTLNERLFMREVVATIDSPIGVAVFGSSRMMELGSDALGSEAVNFGMSGATLEDFAALSAAMAARGIKPAAVVLGIDPWSFNSATNQNRWLHLADLYSTFRKLAGLTPDPRTARAAALAVSLPSRLFSYQAFHSAQDAARNPAFTAALERVPASPGPSNMFLKLRDGTIRYPEQVERRSSDKVFAMARGFPRDGGYGMMGYSSRDPDSEALLRAIVDWYLRAESKVIFALVPYHPAAYAGLAAGPMPATPAIETWVRSLAAEIGATVIGSYDPKQAGCDAAEFMDALHPRRICIARLFTAVEPIAKDRQAE